MKFDSPEWRSERDAMLSAWMKGDQSAVRFILQLGDVAELWDDLIDQDKPWPAADRVNRVFITALFELTGNRFFTENATYLRPLMFAGLNAWLDSVELEQAEDSWSKTWAYVLRDWYAELVPACAFLVGGFEHMRLVSLEARRFLQAETLEQYLEGQ
jgi:hypothetical protein